MSGFGISKLGSGGGTPTSGDLVYFNKLTPTTAGVIFSPNTPATSGLLYISSIDASVWIWDGVEYISYSNDAIVLAVTYSEFYSYITTSQLDIDKKYLITDFQTVYDQPDFSAPNTPKGTVSTLTGSTEPLIVTPVSVDEISNLALSTVYPNDIIFYDWTFIATEIMGVSAKGRITQRTDTSNNTVSYDSRNVNFKRYDDGSGNFTIYYDNGNASNSAVPTFSNISNCYNVNFIVTDPSLSNTNDGFLLPNTVFYGESYNIKAENLFYNNTFTDLYSTTFEGNCSSNIIGGGYDNIIGNYFVNNTIGNNFHNNQIGDGFGNNVLINLFYENNIGYGFYSNTINSGIFRGNQIDGNFANNTFNGNFIYNQINLSFQNNTIAGGFQNNKIGLNFYTNIIGSNFNYNEIAGNFSGNTTGSGFNRNIIDTYFTDNNVGNSFGTNTIGEYFNNNTVGIDFQYNNIQYGFDTNTVGDTFQNNFIGDEFINNTIGNGFLSNKLGNFCWSNNVGFDFVKNNIGDAFQNNTVGNTINDLFIQNNYNSQTISSGTNTQTDIEGLSTGFVKNTNGVLQDIPFGAASQYVRGDGTLASFPDVAGGGGGQVYYCNGGTSEGTIGGNAFYQLSTAAVIGSGVDFTSGTVDNVAFANFITDIGKPTQETIPAGVWIFQCYLSSSNSNTEVYATVEVYDGATFTVLATSLHESLTGNTTIDLYTFTCAVPEYTPLTTTDRIAIRFYPTNLSGSHTITLHTQDSHLSSVQTTFTTGIASLDGLTAAAQYFQVGTSGTDFAVTTSGVDTHVFNLPTASAANRGALSTADWNTFNSKQNAITLTTTGSSGSSTFISNTLNVPTYTLSGLGGVPTSRSLTINGTSFDLSADRTWSVGTVTSVSALTLGTTGTDLSSTVANGTTTPVITLNVPTASATNRGALSSTDWSTFNGKQNAITLTTTGTSGAATLVGSTLNIPNYATGSSSGVCGIANSSGVYTYYATLNLAITAATSGQTVDLLTDITETGSVTITTKEGVKINGNGYTYTLSVNDGTNAITQNSYLFELFNIKVVRTGRANNATGRVLYNTLIDQASLKCYNVVFENTYGEGVLFYGTIYGLSIKSYGRCAYQQYDVLEFYNCDFTSTNGVGIDVGILGLYNSTIKALNTAISIIYVGNVYNSIGISTGSGTGISATRVVNSTGISSSGIGISASNGYNCVGISTSGVGLSGTFTNSTGISTSGYAGSGGTKTNCTLISSSNYASYQENLNNSFLQSTTNVPLWLSSSKLINGCTVLNLWDNVGGHAINTTSASTGVEIRNCNLSVTNASAYCINGASSSNFKYASNTYKGSTTPVNTTNVAQGITNTSDSQGNILI